MQTLRAAEISDGDLQRIVDGELLLLLVGVYQLALGGQHAEMDTQAQGIIRIQFQEQVTELSGSPLVV